MRATRDVPPFDPRRPNPVAYRGQLLPADNPTVRNRPECFEPAPPLEERGPEPPPDEPAAVAQAHIVHAGLMISPGRRFWHDDPVVLENRSAFITALDR